MCQSIERPCVREERGSGSTLVQAILRVWRVEDLDRCDRHCVSRLHVVKCRDFIGQGSERLMFEMNTTGRNDQ